VDESFHTTIEAARLGAEWAWAAIYRDHAPVVLRYLRARGARDAEEVLGAVFLDVVRALQRFEGEAGDFRAWLFTIAQRRLIDDRRRQQRRRDDPVPPELLVDVAPCGDAEHDAACALSHQAVRRTLECLTSDQRDVILLRVLAGLSLADTAVVLGKREGAVKALQNRALRTLHRRLDEAAVSSQALMTILQER
jgi:RNA polymerase sigma-70 factor (ECF subfamily)